MKDDQKFNIWYVKELEKYPCLYNHQDPNYNTRTYQEDAWQAIADAASATVGECRERWKNLRASYTRYLKHRILEMRSGKKVKKPYYLATHMNFLLPFAKAKSFPDDQRYYGDIIKMHDAGENENVVYLDIEDDADYGEELQPNEVDALNHDSTYSITARHLILNEDKGDIVLPEGTRNQQTTFNCSLSKDIDNINTVDYQLKRKAETEHGAESKKPKKEENDADMDFLKSLLPDFKIMNANQKRKFKINVLTLMDDILNSPDASSSQIST